MTGGSWPFFFHPRGEGFSRKSRPSFSTFYPPSTFLFFFFFFSLPLPLEGVMPLRAPHTLGELVVWVLTVGFLFWLVFEENPLPSWPSFGRQIPLGKYAVGTVFRHKRNGYRAVVTSIDPEVRSPRFTSLFSFSFSFSIFFFLSFFNLFFLFFLVSPRGRLDPLLQDRLAGSGKEPAILSFPH